MGRVYGLIGRTLGHSWSVPIHQALGRDDYRLLPLEPEALPAFLARPDLGGVNVTMPYKQTAVPYCDVLSPAVQLTGSANTLARREDGKLYAWNTDLAGFLWMAARTGVALEGRKVLVLGSGGASATVQAAARQAGAGQVVAISRAGADNYDNLNRHRDAQVVVNATPVGMYPNVGAALVDLTQFPACEGVLDLVYNPRRTALLLQAETLGLPCCDGLPMLVAQAAAAEACFTGQPVPASENERVLALLRWEKTNLALIGMPGSGKTTVGEALAKLTGRCVVHTDETIVRRTGRPIPELFAREGEAAFRTLEAQVLREAGMATGSILVTGGGAVTRGENTAAIRQNSRVYELQRPLELLAREGRPLSQTGDLAQLARDRAPLYARLRDKAIQNSGTPEETAAAIWRDFCEHFGVERPEPEPAGPPGAGAVRQQNLP